MRRRGGLGHRRLLIIALVVAGALSAGWGGTTAAYAAGETPWLKLLSTATPTHLPPGGEATILVEAINLGDGDLEAGGGKTLTLSDKVPAGLEVTGARPLQCGAAPAQPVCVKKWPEHVREGEFTEKFPHCTFSASEASCELK